MSFDTIMVILGFATLAFLIYKSRGKKFDIEELIVTKSSHAFKILQTLSTVLETISLSILAVERGQPTFSALSRYITIGVIEILVTLLFIITFDKLLRKAASDGVISLLETFKIFVTTAPIFFAAFYVTNQIHMLYLESINLLEWKHNTNAFLPFFGGYWESNPTLFTDAMYDSDGNLFPAGRNDYGAWIMIYATPLFNVMSVIFITMEVMRNSSFAWSKPKPQEKNSKQTDSKDKDKDKNTDPKERYTKNESEVFNRLSKILGTLSGSNLYNNYKSLCGIESHNGVAKHAQIKDEASLKEFQKNTMNVLLGDPKPEDPSGITGYDYAESTIKKLREDTEYKGILRGINEAEAKLTNESDPVKKRGIETEKKSWEDKQREYENKHKLSKLDKALPKIKEDLSKYCKAIGLIQ